LCLANTDDPVYNDAAREANIYVANTMDVSETLEAHLNDGNTDTFWKSTDSKYNKIIITWPALVTIC